MPRSTSPPMPDRGSTRKRYTDAAVGVSTPRTARLGPHTVNRIGFGAMRLPGKDVWGEPKDPATAHALLKRAIELGINFIDTAWYYGPLVANRLIVEALHPYPSDLVIATKSGSSAFTSSTKRSK